MCMRHTHTHIHATCKRILKAEGNELMESQRTTLGAKANQLLVVQRKRERQTERERELGEAKGRRKDRE